MNAILLEVAGRPVTLGEALAVLAAGALLLLLVALLVAWRSGAARRRAAEEAAGRAAAVEAQLLALARIQSEMTGRMQTMAEVFGSRQADLARGLSERLDGLGHRIGQSLNEGHRHTHENLSRLNERLAVIDRAQKNITELSGQVVGLQQILANKQTRGAFGQARMEAIIADGLPQGGYAFQATLSNRNRPDCLVHLPNDAPGLVIDAKFPLEAWNLLRAAGSPEAERAAQQQFRRDMQTHVKAIAERYFVVGETQDTAFLFVPSESIFADLHEHFEDVVQFAHRARIVIVSPSLLMLSIQVVQALLRDQRMREQAHVIRDQVIQLMQDVGRLDDRVRALQSHFGQTQKDVDQILTSTRKITARGEKIETLDFGDGKPERHVANDAGRREADLLAGE